MSTLPDQIRAAAASGEFAGASRLFEEHAQALLARMRAGHLDEDALREAAGLVEWTRQTALGARSHLEARIQELRHEVHARQAYATPPG